jgi:hypothetical protein
MSYNIIIIIIISGGETESLGTATGLFYQPQMVSDGIGHGRFIPVLPALQFVLFSSLSCTVTLSFVKQLKKQSCLTDAGGGGFLTSNRTEVNVAGDQEQFGQARHFYNGKKTFMQLKKQITFDSAYCTVVRLEGLGKLKNPVTSSGNKPAIIQLIA